MQTSLEGIAVKSALHKEHRFQNLMVLLTTKFLPWCLKQLNKRSAPGVDRVTAWQYSGNLAEKVASLVERVKGGWYRAKLVLRHLIPKPGGELRPLGIPATEDKLLQTTVAMILEAIFEPIFLKCSFGYRPKVGGLDAIRDLSSKLQFKGFNFVVEADIRSFIDSIRHELLMEMLEKKIDDKPFLRLIKKWLKAGVLEKGNVINPVTGTPQGGVISPILANIYLHYALDEWFETVVKAHCRGMVYLCRYADDFVCAFQNEDDAIRFYKVFGKRLGKYGLELAEEKTRIIRFSRHHEEDKSRFEFLGFEFRWGKNRAGKSQLKRRTSRKKLRNSLVNFNQWCKENRGLRLIELFDKLNRKLRGYYNYYGVRGNYQSMSTLFYHATRMLLKWLNRRSQKESYTWESFVQVLKHYRIEKPRITEKKEHKQIVLFNM